MNKKILIVANWKMNLKTNDGVKLVQHVVDNGYDSDILTFSISRISREKSNSDESKSLETKVARF